MGTSAGASGEPVNPPRMGLTSHFGEENVRKAEEAEAKRVKALPAHRRPKVIASNTTTRDNVDLNRMVSTLSSLWLSCRRE